MTCSYAAKNGHLEILKWARANLCPWNEETCTNAAVGGHLELLKWAREHRCPWDEETYHAGIVFRDPALMCYLEEQGCPRKIYIIKCLSVVHVVHSIAYVVFCSVWTFAVS